MNIVLNGSNLRFFLFQVQVNDDLPQNICPFCSHQIKSTHYFILKCQESDKKLRLSLKSWLDANDEDTSINAHLSDDNISFNIGDDQIQNEPAVKRSRNQKSTRRKNHMTKEHFNESAKLAESFLMI